MANNVTPLAPTLTRAVATIDIKQRCSCLTKLERWKWWNHEPLDPSISRPDLDMAAIEVAESLRPIGPTALFGEVEALRLHYGDWVDMTGPQNIRMQRDWLGDFTDWPEDLVIEACARWRNSSAKRSPTPGQLKETVEGEFHTRRSLQTLVAKALAAI